MHHRKKEGKNESMFGYKGINKCFKNFQINLLVKIKVLIKTKTKQKY